MRLRHRATRAVLLAGIAIGVFIPLYFVLPWTYTNNNPLGRDFDVYVGAAELALGGEPFVGERFESGNRTPPWVYPPVAVLAFVPYALLPGPVAFALHTATNVVAALGTATVVSRTVARLDGALTRIDRGLIAGFCLVSPYAVIAIGTGQIDPLVMLALATGYLALERGEESIAGLLFALPAVFKVFPALFGVWLLYRRAWRALGVAVVTGLASILAGVVVFGVGTYTRYVAFVLSGRSQLQALATGSATGPGTNLYFSVTLTKPIARSAPGLSPGWYPVVAAALLTPVLLLVYRRATSPRDRLLAFLATVIAVLLVSPATVFTHLVYLYFPLLSAVYLVDVRPARWTLLGGMGVFLFPIQPWLPRAIAGFAGLGAAYDQVIGGGLRDFLLFGSIPLYGSLAILVGCLLAVGRAETDDTAVS